MDKNKEPMWAQDMSRSDIIRWALTLEAERDGFRGLISDVLEFREAFDSGHGRANWERRARRALATTQEGSKTDGE